MSYVCVNNYSDLEEAYSTLESPFKVFFDTDKILLRGNHRVFNTAVRSIVNPANNIGTCFEEMRFKIYSTTPGNIFQDIYSKVQVLNERIDQPIPPAVQNNYNNPNVYNNVPQNYNQPIQQNNMPNQGRPDVWQGAINNMLSGNFNGPNNNQIQQPNTMNANNSMQVPNTFNNGQNMVNQQPNFQNNPNSYAGPNINQAPANNNQFGNEKNFFNSVPQNNNDFFAGTSNQDQNMRNTTGNNINNNQDAWRSISFGPQVPQQNQLNNNFNTQTLTQGVYPNVNNTNNQQNQGPKRDALGFIIPDSTLNPTSLSNNNNFTLPKTEPATNLNDSFSIFSSKKDWNELNKTAIPGTQNQLGDNFFGTQNDFTKKTSNMFGSPDLFGDTKVASTLSNPGGNILNNSFSSNFNNLGSTQPQNQSNTFFGNTVMDSKPILSQNQNNFLGNINQPNNNLVVNNSFAEGKKDTLLGVSSGTHTNTNNQNNTNNFPGQVLLTSAVDEKNAAIVENSKEMMLIKLKSFNDPLIKRLMNKDQSELKNNFVSNRLTTAIIKKSIEKDDSMFLLNQRFLPKMAHSLLSNDSDVDPVTERTIETLTTTYLSANKKYDTDSSKGKSTDFDSNLKAISTSFSVPTVTYLKEKTQAHTQNLINNQDKKEYFLGDSPKEFSHAYVAKVSNFTVSGGEVSSFMSMTIEKCRRNASYRVADEPLYSRGVYCPELEMVESLYAKRNSLPKISYPPEYASNKPCIENKSSCSSENFFEANNQTLTEKVQGTLKKSRENQTVSIREKFPLPKIKKDLEDDIIVPIKTEEPINVYKRLFKDPLPKLGIASKRIVDDKFPVVRLSRRDYYTYPPLHKLETMARDGRCIVENFIVGRENFGFITFLGETDVFGINLDEIVFIKLGVAEVYTNDYKNKPAVGKELNKKAVITLYNIKPIDPKDKGRAVSDVEFLTSSEYLDYIIESTKKIGGNFLEYDPFDGRWVFEVEHFTKYGIDLLSLPYRSRKRSLNNSQTVEGSFLKYVVLDPDEIVDKSSEDIKDDLSCRSFLHPFDNVEPETIKVVESLLLKENPQKAKNQDDYNKIGPNFDKSADTWFDNALTEFNKIEFSGENKASYHQGSLGYCGKYIYHNFPNIYGELKINNPVRINPFYINIISEEQILPFSQHLYHNGDIFINFLHKLNKKHENLNKIELPKFCIKLLDSISSSCQSNTKEIFDIFKLLEIFSSVGENYVEGKKLILEWIKNKSSNLSDEEIKKFVNTVPSQSESSKVHVLEMAYVYFCCNQFERAFECLKENDLNYFAMLLTMAQTIPQNRYLIKLQLDQWAEDEVPVSVYAKKLLSLLAGMEHLDDYKYYWLDMDWLRVFSIFLNHFTSESCGVDVVYRTFTSVVNEALVNIENIEFANKCWLEMKKGVKNMQDIFPRLIFEVLIHNNIAFFEEFIDLIIERQQNVDIVWFFICIFKKMKIEIGDSLYTNITVSYAEMLEKNNNWDLAVFVLNTYPNKTMDRLIVDIVFRSIPNSFQRLEYLEEHNYFDMNILRNVSCLDNIYNLNEPKMSTKQYLQLLGRLDDEITVFIGKDLKNDQEQVLKQIETFFSTIWHIYSLYKENIDQENVIVKNKVLEIYEKCCNEFSKIENFYQVFHLDKKYLIS